MAGVLLACLVAVTAWGQPEGGPDELYTQGLQLFGANRFAQAIPYFQQLIDIFGREEELQEIIEASLYGLGACQYNVGDYASSIETFKTYIERFPRARYVDEAYFRMASAHQMQDEYDAAVENYRTLLTQIPSSSFAEDAAFQIGLTLMASDKPDEAVTAFEQFVGAFPDSDMVPQALVYMARSYFDSGDYLKALETLERVDPESQSMEHIVYANFLAMEIGDAAFEDTEYKIALRAFRRVRTNESLIRLQRKEIEKTTIALTLMRKAEVPPSELREHFRRERRVLTSLLTLQQSLAKLEESPDYDAGLFHRIGRCFYSTDRFWEARTAYTRALSAATDSKLQEAAHFDLILSLNRLRRFEELIAEADVYLETLGEDPALIENGRVPAVAFMRAESFINMERFEEAETEMASLIETYPEHVRMTRIKFYYALSIAMQERFDEAISLFRQWLEEYPGNIMAAEVAYWLPISMFYNGQYEEAIPLFDAYVEEHPLTVYAPEAAYRSALCKYAMENYEPAAAELEAWLEKYPDHIFQWEARVTLGDALSAIGELERAEAAYRSVTAEGGPMHYLAISQLNKIYKALADEPAYRRMAQMHIEYIKENPDSPNMIESAHNAGWALKQIGRLDEARKLYWNTLERFGNKREWDGFGTLLRDVRSMYGNLPEGSLDSDMNDLISKARRENRRTLVARLHKARMEWEGIDPLAQAEDLMTRFRTEELDAELLAFLGDTYTRNGEAEKGLALLEQLIREFPRSRYMDVAYARKAEALLAEGDATNALAAAEFAISVAMEPSLMMEATFTKGQALEALGRYQDAIEDYHQVLANRASPRILKPRAMIQAAICHEALGEYDKAIPYYQRIYVLYQAFTDQVVEAYLRSARAFLHIRDREAAANTYREMLQSESLADRPELEEARRKLAELEGTSS
ncbi:MAG: tetratricopeptide repeat protein [Verrucomicrobia bacterium]|nr:tetratricopeptide repeat protein [Kiritimatiellia bacterium]MCP5488399.1 tetratricopeptide repeat protein [Verrucomicrobiota bacterium]